MATSVQIINVDVNKKLYLDKDNLKKILLKNEVKDLPVVVISIVGTYRQGKSFILNFFLRFLNLTCKEKKSIQDWLKPADGPLSGFLWKNSWRRETIGIVMWSEVFITQLPSGEEVGIILLDTQGTYDNQTDVNDFAAIFALSNLLSSVQIYNLKENVKQNDLMSLKDFLNYGLLISQENSGEAPFQNFVFLIRDWACLGDFDYGENGGQEYIKQVLRESQGDAKTVSELKKSVRELFKKIICFLVPYPGSNVVIKATNNLAELKDDFKNHVKLLVEKILKPENLQIKEINGRKTTISDLFILIEKYHKEFQSGQMPRIESIFQVTAEVQHLSALEECIKLYEEGMNFDKNPESKSEEDETLGSRHVTRKNLALQTFQELKKMGDYSMNQKYREKLIEKLDSILALYQTLNRTKRQQEEQLKQREELALLKGALAEAKVESENNKQKLELVEGMLSQQAHSSKQSNTKIVVVQKQTRKSRNGAKSSRVETSSSSDSDSYSSESSRSSSPSSYSSYSYTYSSDYSYYSDY